MNSKKEQISVILEDYKSLLNTQNLIIKELQSTVDKQDRQIAVLVLTSVLSILYILLNIIIP